MKIIVLVLLLIGVNSCSDYTKYLGDGYYYRYEGGDIKDISNEWPHRGQIPSTVVDYAYNRRFILASQVPKLPQDILYEKEYEYKEGPNAVYYWIIDKKKHIVYGPLVFYEYVKFRKKLNIKEDFYLKSDDKI